MNQPKVWAEWGRYHDRLYKDNGDLNSASSAVSCYLTAAGLYKNGKSRPLLARVLWFLSQDDSHFAISRAFDTYKGEGAFWFWITLIPQLCTSISLREVKQARYILLNLAKHYPQALFFHIRTTREEIHSGRRIATMRAQAQAAAAAASGDGSVAPPPAPATEGTLNADGTRSTGEYLTAQGEHKLMILYSLGTCRGHCPVTENRFPALDLESRDDARSNALTIQARI